MARPRRPRRGYVTRVRRYNRRALRSRFTARRRRMPIYRTLATRYRKHLALGGFPTKRTVALRYVEDFTLNPGDASTSTYVFRLNNIFDPNYNFGGHQPMYFDNYSTLYSKYKVNYATISFRCLDNHIVNVATPNLVDGTNIGDNQYYKSNERAVRMFIIKDESPTDYNGKINTLIEEGSKNTVWKFAPQNTTGYLHTLKMKCWPHRLMNLNFKDSSLEASVTGAPTREAYFICGVDSMPNSNADSMNYQAIITYNVTFFDFKQNQTEN